MMTREIRQNSHIPITHFVLAIFLTFIIMQFMNLDYDSIQDNAETCCSENVFNLDNAFYVISLVIICFSKLEIAHNTEPTAGDQQS